MLHRRVARRSKPVSANDVNSAICVATTKSADIEECKNRRDDSMRPPKEQIEEEEREAFITTQSSPSTAPLTASLHASSRRRFSITSPSTAHLLRAEEDESLDSPLSLQHETHRTTARRVPRHHIHPRHHDSPTTPPKLILRPFALPRRYSHQPPLPKRNAGDSRYVADADYKHYLLYGTLQKPNASWIKEDTLAKTCAGFSLIGMLFLLFIGLLIETQPLYLKGISIDPHYRKTWNHKRNTHKSSPSWTIQVMEEDGSVTDYEVLSGDKRRQQQQQQQTHNNNNTQQNGEKVTNSTEMDKGGGKRTHIHVVGEDGIVIEYTIVDPQNKRPTTTTTNKNAGDKQQRRRRQKDLLGREARREIIQKKKNASSHIPKHKKETVPTKRKSTNTEEKEYYMHEEAKTSLKAAAAYFLTLVLSLIYVHTLETLNYSAIVLGYVYRLSHWFRRCSGIYRNIRWQQQQQQYVDIPDTSSSVEPILPMYSQESPPSSSGNSLELLSWKRSKKNNKNESSLTGKTKHW